MFRKAFAFSASAIPGYTRGFHLAQDNAKLRSHALPRDQTENIFKFKHLTQSPDISEASCDGHLETFRPHF